MARSDTQPTVKPPMTAPPCRIGIHFAIPAESRLAQISLAERPIMILYLVRSMDVLLRRERILSDAACGHGNLLEGLILLSVTARGRALELIHEFMQAICLLGPCTEIAWLDADESWHIVYPPGAREPFERWLTSEATNLRDAITATVTDHQ